MAISFGGELDLMKCPKAMLRVVEDGNGNKYNCVCIPVDFSQIKVMESKDHASTHAYLRFSMWPLGTGLINWWKQQCSMAGKEISDKTIPTHRIEINYSAEYRQKLHDRAKQVILEQQKDVWTTPETQDENKNKELKNMIYRMTHVDLCTSVWRYGAMAVGGVGYSPAVSSTPVAPDAPSQVWDTNFDANGNMIGGSAASDNLPF